MLIEVRRALVAAIAVGSRLTPCEAAAQTPAAPLATPVLAYSEAETDGPLWQPGGVLLVGDALWVLDTRNDRIVVVRAGERGRSIGREGSGPGEFRWPVAFEHTPDGHVAVWDRSLRRVTIFDRAAQVVATRQFDVTEPGLDPWIVLPTTAGYLALFNTSMNALNPPDPRGEGAGALLRVRSDGARERLSTFPPYGVATVRLAVGDTTRFVWVSAFSDAPAFLDFTPACGGVYLASTGGRSIRWEFFDPAGERIGAFRDDTVAGVPVQRREWEAYLVSLGRDRRAFERVLEPPERHAPVQDLHLTSTGYVLTRSTPRTHRGERAHWRIWPLVRRASGSATAGAPSADAVALATVGTPIDVMLPNRFTPYEMRADTIWGIEIDEMDVPMLRAYRVPVALPHACEP